VSSFTHNNKWYHQNDYVNLSCSWNMSKSRRIPNIDDCRRSFLMWGWWVQNEDFSIFQLWSHFTCVCTNYQHIHSLGRTNIYTKKNPWGPFAEQMSDQEQKRLGCALFQSQSLAPTTSKRIRNWTRSPGMVLPHTHVHFCFPFGCWFGFCVGKKMGKRKEGRKEGSAPSEQENYLP
jgi:hypothetical protein